MTQGHTRGTQNSAYSPSAFYFFSLLTKTCHTVEEPTALEQYILAHISPEHPYLHHLYRQTHLKLLRPRMASGHLQGQLLRMLVQMIQPKLVLELGTYSGYSALSMASALMGDAELHTFELEDEQAAFTEPIFEASPWAKHVHLHVGDVMQTLPTMADERGWRGQVDLVFVDANKRHYSDYYLLLKPLLRPGGWLVADNTLWDGHVVHPEHQHDAQTQGIMAFNDLVATDADVEQVILPLRDGLSIIRKLH